MPPGEGGEADSGGGALFSEINITPLTDVVLVLLIIFMVSSSAMVDAARKGELEVTLPRAGQAQGQARPEEVLVIGVARDGRTYIGDRVVAEDELAEALTATFQRAPHTAIVVDADGGLEHRHVVSIIDRIRSAGFTTVGIGAEEP